MNVKQTAFFERLTAAQRKNNTFLVVGLDPIQEKIPRVVKLAEDPIFSFNKAIVDATLDLVCAYKPNIAFYEAAGLQGLAALKRTIDYIPREIPVILDAKRGDVAHSSKAYAEAIFEYFGADATTVNPYLGVDSIEPFLDYADRGVYLLCLTSNPGYEAIQSADVDGFAIFQLVAQMADSLSEQYPNIGLVVGATHPQEGIAVRNEAGFPRESCPFWNDEKWYSTCGSIRSCDTLCLPRRGFQGAGENRRNRNKETTQRSETK